MTRPMLYVEGQFNDLMGRGHAALTMYANGLVFGPALAKRILTDKDERVPAGFETDPPRPVPHPEAIMTGLAFYSLGVVDDDGTFARDCLRGAPRDLDGLMSAFLERQPE